MHRYGLQTACASIAPAYPVRHGTPCRTLARTGGHSARHGVPRRAALHAGTAGAACCNAVLSKLQRWRVRRCILELYVVRFRRVGGSAPKSRTSRRNCAGAQGLNPPTSALWLGSPRPHLHRDRAHPAHICTGTAHRGGTAQACTGSPRSHLRRDWAQPCHICTRTGFTAPTSALGLLAQRGHICAGTGRTLLISAPGLGSPRPHLH